MASVRDDRGGGDDATAMRRKREMLKLYYANENNTAAPQTDTEGNDDPYNINGPNFQAESYLSRLLRERSLAELMDKETEMVRHIKSLDSDMQTLVYENYNKFISATDTIRKMKNDFKKMEDEMDHLATNMSAITEFSATISSTLQDRRQQITKLSGVHTLLKKLEFLFELPTRLQKCIEMEAYSQAVRYYVKSRRVLHQYQHVASFQGIQQDCQCIVNDLSSKLRDKFRDRDSSAKQLAECVDLLLQLNEPAEQLCDEFLSHARQKKDEDLGLLERQLRLQAGEEVSPDETSRPAQVYLNAPMDVLEFVDCGCNGFLSNMCLVIASYNDMFLNRQQDDEQLDAIAVKKLVEFVNSLMETYFSYVQQRVRLEKATGDNTLLVRALDRFHRRLQAMNKLLPDTDFSSAGTEIVSVAARDRVTYYLDTLKQHLADCLTDTRQQLAAPRLVGKTEGGGASLLSDLLGNLSSSLTDQIKSVLTNLQAFIAIDITFAMKSYFRGQFCRHDVREGLVVASLRNIMTVCNGFCEGLGDKGAPPPTLLLILSRLCLDFEQATITYLLTLTDEQFLIGDAGGAITPVSVLTSEARETAQNLLNHYVRVQGLTISQMLRKSVEARDWLNTIEPRNVRAVMKRVVEDLTAMDLQVGQLYEEGVRKERSSDSTKRSTTYSMSRPTARTNWSFTPSTMDNSLMSNIQKLFSERIEIFSAVEFSKVSVLTGIIKISLKTYLECVRLKTFGRYGLQQVQVDTHYLQLYLWRFVSDENLVHFLLDEIVGSTLHRCLDPVTMETSVSSHRFDLLINRIEQEVERDASVPALSPHPKLTVPRGMRQPEKDLIKDFDEALYQKVMSWSNEPGDLLGDSGDLDPPLDMYNPLSENFVPVQSTNDIKLIRGSSLNPYEGGDIRDDAVLEESSDLPGGHDFELFDRNPFNKPKSAKNLNPFFEKSSESDCTFVDEEGYANRVTWQSSQRLDGSQPDIVLSTRKLDQLVLDEGLPQRNYIEHGLADGNVDLSGYQYTEVDQSIKVISKGSRFFPIKKPWQSDRVSFIDFTILSNSCNVSPPESESDVESSNRNDEILVDFQQSSNCLSLSKSQTEKSFDLIEDTIVCDGDVDFVTNPKFTLNTERKCVIL